MMDFHETYLALGESLEDGGLDLVGVLGETHVLQHHDGGKEESGGVGKALAGDVRSGTVNGLEDGALVTDVAGGGQTETTDKTGAHVGENVTVQVGHDEDLVVVGSGVGDDLEAGVVEELGVELDVRELLGDLAAKAEEETVGHLHDGGLVHDADLGLADVESVLEGVTEHALTGLAGDQLDRLNHTVHNNVLDAGVFALGVLTDEHGVDVVVGGLVSLDALAGTHVGEQVEGPSEGQVEGDVTLADGSSERALEGDKVALDRLDGGVGDNGLAVLVEVRGDIDRLPLDGHAGGGVDVLDGLRDLRTNAVALDQGNSVVAVAALLARESACQAGGGESGLDN
jgi:hypothetical protein